MVWRRRAQRAPVVAVLAAAFNPPTRAHLALARAALAHAGEVVFVLPRAFPHKEYEGPTLEQRLEMMERATAGEPRFSVAVSEGGLFLEIARELRASDADIARVWFVTGRDAAERITGWDYTGREPIEDQLREYELLVAARGGAYDPPPALRERVTELRLAEDCGEVSSTEIRRRVHAGEEWRELAAPGTEEVILRLYGPAAGSER